MKEISREERIIEEKWIWDKKNKTSIEKIKTEKLLVKEQEVKSWVSSMSSDIISKLANQP